MSLRLKWMLKITLAVVSSLLVLLMLEAGLRIKSYMDDRKLFENTVLSERTVADGEKVTLREMVRLESDTNIIYSLKSHLRCELYGGKVSTNRHGFRGPGYCVKKQPGTFRIVGIGDSVMFGQGVNDDEHYFYFLEKKLKECYPTFNIQVINTAVPGYNTVMETATLEDKALAFEPDLVIVGYVGNDLDLPNFIRTSRNPLGLGQSFLFDFLFRRHSGDKENRSKILVNAPFADDFDNRFEYDQDLVPPEYRDMVGLEAFSRAMTHLDDLSKLHGFKVLVFTHMVLPRAIRVICKQRGFPVLEAFPDVQRYMVEHKITNYRGSVLTISDKDPHPSPLLHGLLSDLLFNHLQRHFLDYVPAGFKPVFTDNTQR